MLVSGTSAQGSAGGEATGGQRRAPVPQSPRALMFYFGEADALAGGQTGVRVPCSLPCEGGIWIERAYTSAQRTPIGVDRFVNCRKCHWGLLRARESSARCPLRGTCGLAVPSLVLHRLYGRG